jgi:hypothetical protein
MRRADREGAGGTSLLGRHEALQFFSAIQQDVDRSRCRILLRAAAPSESVVHRETLRPETSVRPTRSAWWTTHRLTSENAHRLPEGVFPSCEAGAWATSKTADLATRVGTSHVAVDGRRGRLYGKAGSGAGTPGPSGVRAVLSNIATIV